MLSMPLVRHTVLLLLITLLAACAPLAQRAEILWDSYGIPHIYADATEEVFYGFGWAQMESHANALLRLYGLASGEAAEHWGEAFLETDHRHHTIGGPRLVQRMIDGQSPEVRVYVRAFIDGINDYAETHPDRISDSLRVVLPVTESHVAGRMVGVFLLFSDAARQSRQWSPGSNAWAITGPKSASGAAMLLANPHLPYADEFKFYEAHLSGPAGDIYGATLLGLPVIAIGFNERLGWTHTVNTQDHEDFYELRLADGGYVFDGEVRPFETDTTLLRVRGPAGGLVTDTLITRRSIHGPVIAASGDRALAWRALPIDGAIDQWWQMGTAKGMADFEEALQAQQLVGFTVTYADREGNILHHYGAATPERPVDDRAFWLSPVPGDVAATLWHDTHDYHDLPRLANPPSGWVQNANEASFWGTWPPAFDRDEFPDYFGPPLLPFRPQRSIELLDSAGPLTFEAFDALRRDTRLAAAERIVPELVEAAREHGGDLASRAADVLEAWDLRVDAQSRGGVLFRAWYMTMAQRGERIFETPWSEADPRGTPAGLRDPAGAVAVLESVAQQVEAQAGALDVPWGAVNRLRIGDVDAPASGGPGELGSFRVFSFRPDDDGRSSAVHGDSFVMIVEFGEAPRARALMVYGNSTQEGSPHRTDQVEMAASGDLRPVWFTREEVEANVLRRDVLGD